MCETTVVMSVPKGRPEEPTAPPSGAASAASVGAVSSSEPSVGEPAVDLIEAIETPERLAIHENERRAENAARNGTVDFALQCLLHRGVVDARARSGAVGACVRCDVGGDIGIGNVATVEEVTAIQRFGDAHARRGI